MTEPRFISKDEMSYAGSLVANLAGFGVGIGLGALLFLPFDLPTGFAVAHAVDEAVGDKDKGQTFFGENLERTRILNRSFGSGYVLGQGLMTAGLIEGANRVYSYLF